MADIYKAYQFLNQSLGLGLSETQMSRAEALVKLEFAKERGFVLSEADTGKFALHVFFQPKAGVEVVATSRRSASKNTAAPAKQKAVGKKAAAAKKPARAGKATD